MQVCVRAHDLEVKGLKHIISALRSVGADGAQLVGWKSFEDVENAPAGITPQRALEIGAAFRKAGLTIGLIGAYFNPVHSDSEKVGNGVRVFCDYLAMSGLMGCSVVGSETGSYSDEPWVYHPGNRAEEALGRIVEVFRGLCDFAATHQAIVGIEGASGHVCYDIETLNGALRMISRDNLRIIFDLYNFLDNGNCRDYLSILTEGLTAFAGRIHCFHIKDCIFTKNGIKQCAVGKGDMDFGSIMAMIKSYDKDAILVLEGTKSSDLKQSIRFIRDMWIAA